MKALKFISPIVALAFLASCGGGGEKKDVTKKEAAPKEKAQVCTYSFNPDETDVIWTAYKLTEKVGVKGKFDSIMVDGTTPSSNKNEVVRNATFSIYTESVNTGDADRDRKIKEYFFGKLDGGGVLSGKIIDIEGEDASGVARIELEMNGMPQMIEGEYTITGDKMQVEAEITTDMWEAQNALAALNEVCSERHTGPDGKNVLWPDVSLLIRTTFDTECK